MSLALGQSYSYRSIHEATLTDIGYIDRYQTTTNHDKPQQTTTNHHKPPQSVCIILVMNYRRQYHIHGLVQDSSNPSAYTKSSICHYHLRRPLTISNPNFTWIYSAPCIITQPLRYMTCIRFPSISGQGLNRPWWRHQMETYGQRWIPRTKASDAELWCFLWSEPE